MATVDPAATVFDALVLDINGAAAGRDDVIIPKSGAMRLLRNYVTAGYASLPDNSVDVTGFLASIGRYAAGDFSGDGFPDLIGADGSNIRRYLGDGSGGFAPLPIAFGTSGFPAVVGRTAAVANTRLRLYDQRCTVAPPGFPAAETFVAGGLCASIALPGTAIAMVAATRGPRNYLLTVTGSTVAVYEITTVVGPGFAVNAMLRSSATIANVTDVAWSPADGVFVFARTTTLVARALSSAGLLSTVPTLQEVALETAVISMDAARQASAYAPPSVAAPGDAALLAKIVIGEMVPGERSVVVTNFKTETFQVLPFSVAAGWRRTAIATGSFDVDPNTTQLPVEVVVGQFNDDNLLDVGVLDGTSGNFIIVRQQPPPCISFITSASHGLLADPSYTPTARFNRLLADRVAVANAARRPRSWASARSHLDFLPLSQSHTGPAWPFCCGETSPPSLASP